MNPQTNQPAPGQAGSRLSVNPMAPSVSYAPRVGGSMPGVSQPTAQPVKVNPNSTQNALLIAEIRDGIVIMSDGSFRSVVMVKSINFVLMSPEEQEAVEF